MENKQLQQAKDAVAKQHLQYDNAVWDDVLNQDKLMLIDEVATTYADSQWIDVKERMPVYNQKVLAYRCESDVSYQSIDTIVYGLNSTGFPSGVTYWMPLPNPPKK